MRWDLADPEDFGARGGDQPPAPCSSLPPEPPGERGELLEGLSGSAGVSPATNSVSRLWAWQTAVVIEQYLGKHGSRPPLLLLHTRKRFPRFHHQHIRQRFLKGNSMKREDLPI